MFHRYVPNQNMRGDRVNWGSLELIGSADMLLVRNQTAIKFPISSGLDLDLDYWILLLCCTFDVFMFTLNLELMDSTHIWYLSEIKFPLSSGPAAAARAVEAQFVNFQSQKKYLVQEHCSKLQCCRRLDLFRHASVSSTYPCQSGITVVYHWITLCTAG